jgi:crotonobetainyl-CoA:carnitine CoA-transferase CaiB-like acyl-CoA transferase
MAGPLAGIRILDLSRILAGPSCTQLLGDLGADVIKIEHPERGDDTRAWGPPFAESREGTEDLSAYYLSANRNKRSVGVDLAVSAGAELVRQLARTCDVLVENFPI